MPAEVSVFGKLIETSPIAGAMILLVWLFLRANSKREEAFVGALARRDDAFVARMKDSQLLGHQVATELAERYERTLESVTAAHASALKDIAAKTERLAAEIQGATQQIVRLCTLLERAGIDSKG